MCELMGMSFERPVPAAFSIREFALRGDDNADGWGLAWYPDQSLAIIKEPLKWRESKHSSFLESYHYMQSRIYIAHVRHKTTGGEPTHADTHPFRRELGGREYCCAHNGTLSGSFWELPLERYRPIGSTDSEFLFCYLLEAIAGWGGRLDHESQWRKLHAQLHDLNRNSKINLLLSDGKHLFAYRDVKGWKGLSFCKEYIHKSETHCLADAMVRVDLQGDLRHHGFVIATRPLSADNWHSFQPGEMLVLKDGKVCFSSHRSMDNGVFAPSKKTQVLRRPNLATVTLPSPTGVPADARARQCQSPRTNGLDRLS